jgi:hypothetical protein
VRALAEWATNEMGETLLALIADAEAADKVAAESATKQ